MGSLIGETMLRLIKLVGNFDLKMFQIRLIYSGLRSAGRRAVPGRLGKNQRIAHKLLDRMPYDALKSLYSE